MNKLKLLLILLVTFSIFSCSENDDPEQRKEKVQFSLDFATASNSGGRAANDLPAGAKLVLTLSNSSGIVLDKHSVAIYNFSGSYVSDPLELAVGNFAIQEFFIVDASNNVIYATPKAGSQLTSVVEKPLPTRFNVSKGKIYTLDMQVLSTEHFDAAAFGYASFNIDVVELNPLNISVFIEENGKLVLTDAYGYFFQHSINDSIQDFNLGAKVNTINFKGSHTLPHTLSIRKVGYELAEKGFIYDELVASGSGRPSLVVVLKKMTDGFLIPADGSTSPMEFSLGFSGAGTIHINWDDGISETFQFTPDDVTVSDTSYHRFYHQYNGPDGYIPIVSITGDLDKITKVAVIYCFIQDMNVNVLPSLKELKFENSLVTVLDVSLNPHLSKLILSGTEVLNFVVGEDNVELNDITLTEVTLNTTPEIINEVYQYAMDKQLRNGRLAIKDSDIVGSSPDQLQALEEELDWTITIDP
jgi:hypothetical protein